MKKEYESLELRVLLSEMTDVITASGNHGSTNEDDDVIGGDIF